MSHYVYVFPLANFMQFTSLPFSIRSGLLMPLVVSCWLAGFTTEVRSEVQVMTLPSVMADYALNPTTGDIATIDPKANRAYLFRAAALRGETVKASGEVQLGETPLSITYKRFGNMQLFAAVCNKDPHMYILDANKFTLVKKVPLPRVGAVDVVASLNPQDPFVYYSIGESVGAVDLRKMVDRGEVFRQRTNSPIDFAISADGRIVYGYDLSVAARSAESLQMTNSLKDDKPTFAVAVKNRTAGPSYIPDPFGYFTASGRVMYTKNIEKDVAKLKFVPSCFFRTKPVFVGLEGLNIYRLPRSAPSFRLRAASYNTLIETSKPVELPPTSLGALGSLPRLSKSKAAMKSNCLTTHVLADDKNNRVIFAFRDNVTLVPLADFKLPAEPLMMVDVGSTDLTVGKQEMIKISVRDPRVKLEYVNLPDGVKKTEGGLQWTPKSEHVGRKAIPVKLSFGEIQRVINVEFQISRNFRQVPFEIGGFHVSEKATQAVCWSGPGLDQQGNLNRYNEVALGKSQQPQRIAIISLDDHAAKIRTMTRPYPVKKAVALGPYIAILSAGDSSRVEILDAKTMKRTRTMLSTSPLKDVTSKNNQLLLRGTSSIDVYDTTTFKKTKTIDWAARPYLGPPRTGRDFVTRSRSNLPLKDGVWIGGILYDAESNKPKLIVSPNGFSVIGKTESGLHSGSFLRRFQVKPSPTTQRSESSSNTVTIGPIPIPSRGVTVSMVQSLKRLQLPPPVFTSLIQYRVSLEIKDRQGARRARIPIVNEIRAPVFSGNSGEKKWPMLMMEVVGEDVFFSVGDRLFRWSAENHGLAVSPDSTPEDGTDFHFVPQQTTFVANATKTELRHVIKGGTRPFRYQWFLPLEGVTLDEQTGTVTIDGPVVMKQAEAQLVAKYSRRSDVAQAIANLRVATVPAILSATKILGRKPTGIPVAIPIHLRAYTSMGYNGKQKIAMIQYFVLMEVPYASVVSKIKVKVQKLHASRLVDEKARAAAAAAVLKARSQTPAPSNTTTLEKRIQSLEAKIDMLLHQLSESAKKKDQKNE